MAATVRHPGFESRSCRFFSSPFSPSRLSSNKTSMMYYVCCIIIVICVASTGILTSPHCTCMHSPDADFSTVSPTLLRKITLSSRSAVVLVWSVPASVVDDIDGSVISVVMLTPSGPRAIQQTTVGKRVIAFAVYFPEKGARYQVTVRMMMNGLLSRSLTVEVDI